LTLSGASLPPAQKAGLGSAERVKEEEELPGKMRMLRFNMGEAGKNERRG
jgi:hypothetical protein